MGAGPLCSQTQLPGCWSHRARAAGTVLAAFTLTLFNPHKLRISHVNTAKLRKVKYLTKSQEATQGAGPAQSGPQAHPAAFAITQQSRQPPGPRSVGSPSLSSDRSLSIPPTRGGWIYSPPQPRRHCPSSSTGSGGSPGLGVGTVCLLLMKRQRCDNK